MGEEEGNMLGLQRSDRKTSRERMGCRIKGPGLLGTDGRISMINYKWEKRRFCMLHPSDHLRKRSMHTSRKRDKMRVREGRWGLPELSSPDRGGAVHEIKNS